MKYVQVVQWSAEDGDVHLEMLGEDQQVHRFEVSAGCAEALAGALAAEAAKHDGQDQDRQAIRPTGMQTGKTAQNEPVLFMTLPGGVELPLVFKRESLGVLISELEKLKGVIEPGSQVQWR